MENKLEERIEELTRTIATLRVSDEDKTNLLEVVKGIIASSNHRVYTIRKSDLEEYISIRTPQYQPNEKADFCISKRYIDYNGTTAGRSSEFISLLELVNYIRKNLPAIKLSLYNIEETNRQKDLSDQVESDLSNPQDYINFLKSKISRMLISEEVKNRACLVLDELIKEKGRRVYLEKNNYSETYIIFSNNRIYLKQSNLDSTGFPGQKFSTIITTKDVCELAEKYKISLDESPVLKRKL